jgi:ribosomal protein L39E
MGRLGEGGDHENGPKRCVWRRLGLSYVFFLFRVLLLLTTVLGTIYLWEGGDDENGPKRRVWRRLPHSQVISFFCVLLILTNVF